MNERIGLDEKETAIVFKNILRKTKVADAAPHPPHEPRKLLKEEG